MASKRDADMSIRDSENDALHANEATPLLPRGADSVNKRGPVFPLLFRLLLCAFMVSLSFGVTQVPMLYIFRYMTCEAYYQKHQHLPTTPGLDRCAVRPVEARAAREISILGASTTLFGIANLLVATWSIKKFGVKTALMIQVFWPAARLLTQNYGAMLGGNKGILLIQSSQIITIIGGPNGYVLALNAFITDVVKPEERTGALGRIQGSMMIGSAVGFLTGGILGDAFGILAPFRITLALFLLCTLYVALSLPTIPTDRDVVAQDQKPIGIMRYFGPLRIFAPQKWTLKDGRTSRQYGALMLGIGVFLAILATGYLYTLLQLYASNRFAFSTSENGGLIFMYSSLRGLYLSFIFPRVIDRGRKWLQPHPKNKSSKSRDQLENAEEEARLAGVTPNEVEVADTMDAETEPLNPLERKNEQETFAFDLLYARCSLLVDGILTGLAVFVSQGWQLYIVAVMLPLAAGTGSASKGSILQMIPSKDRVDALSGITLVENVARLSTISVFGFVFAALAEIGKTHLVFVCNAGVALLGFTALLFSHFPPEGSRRTED